jgi:hypothetical protein
VRQLNDILPKVLEMDKLVSEIKKSKRSVTVEEQKFIDSVNKVVNDIIQVDEFDKLGIEKHQDSDYVRPALRNTKFANLQTSAVVATVSA